MSEMVERIARAMHTFTVKTTDAVKHEYGVYEMPYQFKEPIVSGLPMLEAIEKCNLMNARAALQALRDPTEEMIEAGEEADILEWSPQEGEGLDAINIKPAWQAMIDEALK